MYWVKTMKGNLCNLALASDLRVCAGDKDGTGDVMAFFPGSGEYADKTLLFTGTREEAEAYLSRLAAKLVTN